MHPPQRVRFLAIIAGAALGLVDPAMAQTDAGRAYAADLGADASGRTSLLGAAPSGPTVKGVVQFRYLANSRDEVPGDEDTALGFQTRRTRLNLEGEPAEGWSYSIVTLFKASDGSFVLDDAYVTWAAGDRLDVRAGQFKVPLLREDLVSDARQLVIERSNFSSEFGQSRSQAIQIGSQGERVGWALALSDGLTTLNTDFTSEDEADWAVTGRLEYLGAGEWASFRDLTSPRGQDLSWMGGLAGHFQSGGDTFATADTDVWELTADAGVEGDGWNAFGAVVWRSTDGAGADEVADWGLLVQTGLFIADDTELFGRWDILIPDDDLATDEEFSEFTAGLNHYLLGGGNHTLKLSGDVTYCPDGTTGSIVPTGGGTGILASDDEQWLLRVQMQLLF